jgi:hypothetical protein
VKKVGITVCTRRCLESFTLWYSHVLKSQGAGVVRKKKCPTEKNPNRAGATSLFALSAAQNVLEELPPCVPFPVALAFFRRAQRVSEIEP